MAASSAMSRRIQNSDLADSPTHSDRGVFPISSLSKDVLSDSDHSTVCSWKGTAAYWDITVDGQTATNAAWYYPEPMKGAEQVADRVAFYPAVTVES